jgi:GntR family transcriptional regulator
VKLNSDGRKPIYIQISEWLENEILNGNILEDGKIYSQYQLAEMYNINPATAAKGLNLLADEDILYKKRGLGMFVSTHAKSYILKKRRDQILETMVLDLVVEAKRLDVSEDELIDMIKTVNKQHKGES